MKIPINDNVNNNMDFDIEDCIDCPERDDCVVFQDVLDQIHAAQDDEMDYGKFDIDIEDDSFLFDMIEDWIDDYADEIGDDVVLDIFEDCEITADIPFDNCMTVTAKLADGFVIFENYVNYIDDDIDCKVVVDRCMTRITNKAVEHILFVTRK